MLDMAPFKSPGNNGLHAALFQKPWDTVGNSLCEYALNFFSHGILPEGSKDTLLALIPKVNNLESPSQILPINLCNVGYKTITKALTNKLKELMPHLTAPNQMLGKYHNSLSSRFMRGVRINRSSDTQYLRGSAQTCLLHGLLQIFH